LYAWNGKVNPKTRVHQYSDEGFIQIIELSKQKDEELKKMLDNGWLLGTFK
jgi:hypothetical protein